MNLKLLSNCLDQQWAEISKNAKNSVVILDNPSAECLHWHGGLKRLFDHGAISVENFSPFVSAGPNISNILFVLSAPFTSEIARILTVILRANDFKHCVLISSLPLTHFYEDPDTDLEHLLCSWMDKRDATACVRHIPFHAAHITNNLLILPSFASQFSVYQCGLTEMNRNRNEEVSIKSVPEDMQHSIKHLASSLSSLFERIGVRAETFSLGPLSHLLGNEMEALAQQIKKAPTKRASLVCVDRLLDLAGPCSQSMQHSTLAQILQLHPRLQGHTFDIAVPMHALAHCKSGTVFDRPLLAPGCLAHKETTAEQNLLQAILYKSPRDVLMAVNRSLAEGASRVTLDSKLFSAKLTPEQVKSNIMAFRSASDDSDPLGLLELACAAVSACDVDCALGGAVEGALLESLAQSPERVLESLMEMVGDKENKTGTELDAILTFLAFFYLLSGESSINNESAMQATLMEEFFHDRNREKLISLFVSESEPSDESALEAVRTLFDVLRRLGSVRRTLQRYKSLFVRGEPAFPASYFPLLKQLLEDMFDPSLAQVPDLAFHSAGLKDYLKTGFSLFVNVARANPRSNPLVFVLVLGGVTPAEIQLFKEARRGEDTEVVLLCCGLVTPQDVLKDLGQIVKDLQLDLDNNEEDDSS